MRVEISAANPVEKVVLALGLAPEPILVTQIAFTMARAIAAGVDLGIYDALEAGSLSAEEIAHRCQLDPRACCALLNALVGCDYLHFSRRAQRYALRRVARRWLLRSSKYTLANKMVFQKMEWEALANLEEFVRSGQSVDLHHGPTSEAEWSAYQLGMTDLGRLALPEAAVRAPIPRRARDMLDIGGSGGTYAAAMLRSHPRLACTIVDLPAAVKHAEPMVHAHGLGSRLRIRAGNALLDDLGKGAYDFIFMSNVAHHFSDAENLEVSRKAAAALRPGGVFCIQEIERAREPSPKNQIGALMDLYFAMTSRSGTWSETEIGAWLCSAGLKRGRTVRFRTAPALIQVWGRRPKNDLAGR